MYQGFYELTSGMLTQQRNLNTISNNLANIETAGYKKDTQVNSTFDEEMLIRTGRYNKKNPKELGVQTPIVKADETLTDFSQGVLHETGQKYDFAIEGEGFFNIQTNEGIRYTRNGSFSLNENGDLMLDGLGLVLGQDGNPIHLDNEDVNMDSYGRIIYQADGRIAGQIRLTGLDTNQLVKEDSGLYRSDDAGSDLTGQTRLINGSLERSNADMVKEMTSMMSSQRALQSAAQMLRMYDNVLSKASNDVGQI
ncbi:MAG: flagellar hook-basal body protein [Lachnospiraceae bacterium]|nr:flagellar hook-basal body protein [Lachnospiraceae bacterium]